MCCTEFITFEQHATHYYQTTYNIQPKQFMDTGTIGRYRTNKKN